MSKNIELKHVLFDKGMLNTLKDLGRNTSNLVKLNGSGFRLARIKGYLADKFGPVNKPIRVKLTDSGYKVMSGRHRVVYSLLRNYKTVPAYIVKN